MLDLLVRIKHQPAEPIVSKTDWRTQEQFAARCLIQNPALKTCSQHMEFGFAHRALQPEQQPIVEMSRIIDAVLVENQGIGQSADLEKSMPVHRVSREPGHLKPEDDAGTSEADFRDKTLESFPVGGRSPGLAEVGIDDYDLILLPAESNRMLPKRILPLCAFDVLKDLTKCGLPDIEISSPFQMRRFDFLVCIRSHATPFELCEATCWQGGQPSRHEDQLGHRTQDVPASPFWKARRGFAGRLPSSIGNPRVIMIAIPGPRWPVRQPATGVLRKPRPADGR